MVFLSHSLSFFRDFHFTVKVCLREYTGYSLPVETVNTHFKASIKGFSISSN